MSAKWVPDGWDEELEVRKAMAHDKECELAALAVLKERNRLRPTNKRKNQPAQSPEDYDDLGRKLREAGVRFEVKRGVIVVEPCAAKETP